MAKLRIQLSPQVVSTDAYKGALDLSIRKIQVQIADASRLHKFT